MLHLDRQDAFDHDNTDGFHYDADAQHHPTDGFRKEQADVLRADHKEHGANAHRQQRDHDYLYWEFPEHGFKQAVRMGNWKAVRNAPDAPLELYDLTSDLGEEHDVAEENPKVVARVEEILSTARTKSDYLPIDRQTRAQ